MNHLQIAFEDSQHLRSQIGHLYDTFNAQPLEQAAPSLALWDTSELKAELERRAFNVGDNDPVVPDKEKAKPGRKPKATPAPPPAAANDPEPEPEPDVVAMPAKVQDIDREAGGVASDIPSSDDMEALLSRYFAAASLDALRQVVFEVTGAKTLKAAPKETWPALKTRLEHELTVGAK